MLPIPAQRIFFIIYEKEPQIILYLNAYNTHSKHTYFPQPFLRNGKSKQRLAWLLIDKWDKSTRNKYTINIKPGVHIVANTI